MGEKVFVNCTNHRLEFWSEKQLSAAAEYGKVEDYAFPSVKAGADEREIAEIGEHVFQEIMGKNPAAVLCQGEFTLTFYLVQKFLEAGVTVLAACSERVVREKVEDGKNIKNSEFCFVRFRKYEKGR